MCYSYKYRINLSLDSVINIQKYSREFLVELLLSTFNSLHVVVFNFINKAFMNIKNNN